LELSKKELIETLETEIPEDATIAAFSVSCIIKKEVVGLVDLGGGGGGVGPKSIFKKRAPKSKRGWKDKKEPFSRRSSKKKSDDPAGKVTERDVKIMRKYIDVCEANGRLASDEDQLDTWLELKDLKVRSMSDTQKKRIKDIFDSLKAKDRSFA